MRRVASDVEGPRWRVHTLSRTSSSHRGEPPLCRSPSVLGTDLLHDVSDYKPCPRCSWDARPIINLNHLLSVTRALCETQKSRTNSEISPSWNGALCLQVRCALSIW